MQTLRRLTTACGFVLVLATSATAQTEVRYYLVPEIGDGLLPQTARRPKYGDLDSLGPGWPGRVGWALRHYAAEGVYLVGATLTVPDHTTLSAQPDVVAIPSPIDSNVSSAALATVQSKLEGMHLPGQWVTTSHTYRQILKGVNRIMRFVDRYEAIFGGSPFTGGITLDTQINQLTQAQRNRLNQAATSLGLDTSGVTQTMTIRDALRLIADQLPDEAFGGDVF